MRRGNLEVIDLFKNEIASLRSQRRLKTLFQQPAKKERERIQCLLN